MAREVGIVGGGLVGCLAALRLARRGVKVTIFERRERLLLGASRNNEGKVHLGYTYGLDPTGATRELMFDHGLAFEPLLIEQLGEAASRAIIGRRQHYLVHRDSALGPDRVDAHMAAIAALHNDPASAVRRLADAEVRATYSDLVVAVYDVDEPSVECAILCDIVADAVAAEPNVAIQTGIVVDAIDDAGRPDVRADGGSAGRFDAVINAAWDGMPAIERRAGAMTHELLIRAKVGFVTTLAAGRLEQAVTIVYGAYGDMVPLGAGRFYLSWYPEALMGMTTDVSEGTGWFERIARGFDFAECYRRSRAGLEAFVPGLAFADAPLETRAGAILAAAKSDIVDPESDLHKRTRIGIFQRGNVFAVDTGKFTAAPTFAKNLAELIA